MGNSGTLGATVTEPNENVIYDRSNRQAPASMDDFWTVFAEWLANGFDVTGYNPITNANETTTYVPFTAPDKNWQIEDYTGNQSDVWTGIYDFVSPFTTPDTSSLLSVSSFNTTVSPIA